MERKRRNIHEKERQAIFKAWNNKCAYCEQAPAEVVDHIVPFSKGGPCELENFAAACSKCNLRKTNHDLPEGYLAIITAIAVSKAEGIRKNIEKAKTPKPKAATKKPVRKKSNTKEPMFYIRASSYCDWTDETTELLKRFKDTEDGYHICKGTDINSDLLYTFSILCSLPTGLQSNPLVGWTTYEKDNYIEATLKSEFMPVLEFLAVKKPKKNEVIEIDAKQFMLSVPEDIKAPSLSEAELEVLYELLRVAIN